MTDTVLPSSGGQQAPNECHGLCEGNTRVPGVVVGKGGSVDSGQRMTFVAGRIQAASQANRWAEKRSKGAEVGIMWLEGGGEDWRGKRGAEKQMKMSLFFLSLIQKET